MVLVFLTALVFLVLLHPAFPLLHEGWFDKEGDTLGEAEGMIDEDGVVVGVLEGIADTVGVVVGLEEGIADTEGVAVGPVEGIADTVGLEVRGKIGLFGLGSTSYEKLSHSLSLNTHPFSAAAL